MTRPEGFRALFCKHLGRFGVLLEHIRAIVVVSFVELHFNIFLYVFGEPGRVLKIGDGGRSMIAW